MADDPRTRALRGLLIDLGCCWACEEAEIDGEAHDDCTAGEGYACECYCQDGAETQWE